MATNTVNDIMIINNLIRKNQRFSIEIIAANVVLVVVVTDISVLSARLMTLMVVGQGGGCGNTGGVSPVMDRG